MTGVREENDDVAFLKACETPETWDAVDFPVWIPEKLKQQIISFWSCFGRKPIDWIKDNRKNTRKFGEMVDATYGIEYVDDVRNTKRIKGRFVHAWNNMERVVVGDEYFVVADFDIKKKDDCFAGDNDE